MQNKCYQTANNSTPYWTYERSTFGAYHASHATCAPSLPSLPSLSMPPPLATMPPMPHSRAHSSAQWSHSHDHSHLNPHSSQVRNQLALTSAHSMWTPMDCGYGYGYRHAIPNAVCNHMSCCGHPSHANQWQTSAQSARCVSCEASRVSHVCHNSCHNSCNTCNNCSRHSNDAKTDTTENNNTDDLEDNVASVTVSDNSCVQTSDDMVDDVSESAQLRGINDTLRLTLEETTHRLHKTQQLLIKANEKNALEYIDTYRQNLKTFGDYIKEECTRFYQNESIAKRLEPIVEQVTVASNKAKEEKEKIRLEVASMEEKLNEEMVCLSVGGTAPSVATAAPDTSTFYFDYNCLPKYPDLLQFYKSILDQIPLAFLSDLSQLKKCAVKYIESKNQINSNRFDATFSHFNILPSMEANDTEKQDFPFMSMSMPVAMPMTIPTHDSLFANNDETLTLTTNLSQYNIETNGEHTLSHSSEPQDEKPNILPIGQSYATEKKDIIVNYSKNSQSKENIAPTDPIVSSLQNVANQSLISNMNDTLDQNSISRQSDANFAQKLSQAQIKLLAKLKEKYKDLNDEELIESITKTKATLIKSGNPKGFSGMKVIDIIAKISAYIDSNMIASISDSRTWPTLGQQLNGF